MSNRLRIALGWSALWFGLALAPANASESRISFFTFLCNGQSQVVNFNASALGNSITRLVQGAEISLFQNPGGPGFVAMFINADPNRAILTMPVSDNRAANQFTGFFPYLTSPTGNIVIEVQGFCTGGGTLQGLATVSFF